MNDSYLFAPTCQNIEPNTNAANIVKIILIALYGGFLQYRILCFHKHLTNCDHVFCEYNVSNFNGFEPGEGCSYCLIAASTDLRKGCDVDVILMRNIT